MVRMSEKIDQIAIALNKLQAINLAVEKTETNPHFKSKFADLEGHWEMLRDPMTKLGLAVTQLPSTVLDKPALTTIIMHTSGQFIESTTVIAFAAQDPQKQVAAITYMRRAALSGATGTVAVEDDDGNMAASKPRDVVHAQQTKDPANYRVAIGKKYYGQSLGEIGHAGVASYADWLENEARQKNKPLEGAAKEFIDMADQFLKNQDLTKANGAHQSFSNLMEQWEQDLPAGPQ